MDNDIFASTDSVQSNQSVVANRTTSPKLPSPPCPPNTFVNLFSHNIKRCSRCMASVVHFLIICSLCNKMTCCRCIEQVGKCCNIVLLNKLNRILRTAHYANCLQHVCNLNQNSPPVKKYYDDMTDSVLGHKDLVQARFSLQVLSEEKLNESLVVAFIIDLVNILESLESLYVHLLFSDWVPTNRLTENLSTLNGKISPNLPPSNHIDVRFKMLYQTLQTAQMSTRRQTFFRNLLSNGLHLMGFLVTVLFVWLLST